MLLLSAMTGRVYAHHLIATSVIISLNRNGLPASQGAKLSRVKILLVACT